MTPESHLMWAAGNHRSSPELVTISQGEESDQRSRGRNTWVDKGLGTLECGAFRPPVCIRGALTHNLSQGSHAAGRCFALCIFPSNMLSQFAVRLHLWAMASLSSHPLNLNSMEIGNLSVSQYNARHMVGAQ